MRNPAEGTVISLWLFFSMMTRNETVEPSWFDYVHSRCGDPSALLVSSRNHASRPYEESVGVAKSRGKTFQSASVLAYLENGPPVLGATGASNVVEIPFGVCFQAGREFVRTEADLGVVVEVFVEVDFGVSV